MLMQIESVSKLSIEYFGVYAIIVIMLIAAIVYLSQKLKSTEAKLEKQIEVNFEILKKSTSALTTSSEALKQTQSKLAADQQQQNDILRTLDQIKNALNLR